MSTTGPYWYDGGYNKAAVATIIPAAAIPAICAFVPSLSVAANFTWFIGVGLGFAIYAGLMRQQHVPLIEAAPS
jgi:NCS1 family nucleobase:cation symporter-1